MHVSPLMDYAMMITIITSLKLGQNHYLPPQQILPQSFPVHAYSLFQQTTHKVLQLEQTEQKRYSSNQPVQDYDCTKKQTEKQFFLVQKEQTSLILDIKIQSFLSVSVGLWQQMQEQ